MIRTDIDAAKRAPWNAPALTRLDAAHARLGLVPIRPENQAMGS